jgi:quinolinate synthase
MNEQLVTAIKELKEQKNAQILAHYYETADIQDIADEVGDSLYLAQKGRDSEAGIVLLAGVVFMAESVKILSPNKKVLVPDREASCSLVHGSPYAEYLSWRQEHPEAIAVTYINSSAEIKAISDVICTSSNAESIVASIPKERSILFGPDKNLGHYLAKKFSRPMLLWEGECEVHVMFSASELHRLRSAHPDAVVLAHPECNEGILQQADVVGSTSRLLKEVHTNPAKQFIVATEEGIFHQMRKMRPDVELIQSPVDDSCGCAHCPYMKLNTLEKIYDALRTEEPKIHLSQELLELASVSLNRMMDITDGKTVDWPESFVPPQL